MKHQAPDIEEEPAKAVRIGYNDRWKWLKHMLAQAPEVLGNGVKIVLVAVWEAADKQTGLTTRLQSTIAQATGLKVGTVKDYLAAARRAGFIESEGKGGHVYDEAGNKVPIASRYRLTLPTMAIATCSGASSDESGSKGRPEPGQVAMKMAASSDHSRYYTPSFSPSSSPIDSPDFPIASLKEVASWGDCWPSMEDALVNSSSYIGSTERARRDLGYEICALLGWSTPDAIRYKDEAGHYPHEPILLTLGNVVIERLCEGMARGDVSRQTLANVLARAGYEPRKEGESNAKAFRSA